MRSLLLYICLLISTQGIAQQSWQWGIRGGGSTNGVNQTEETVVDMATDNAGNVYILAIIEAEGFPTLSGYAQALPRYGDKDILVASYSCNGTFRWKKVIGGYGEDMAAAIGVDSIGHVYVAGRALQPSYYPPPQTQPSPIHFDTDSTQAFTNTKTLFLLQYDTSGIFKWLRQPAPDTSSTVANLQLFRPFDIAVTPAGRVDMLCALGKGRVAGGGNFVADTSTQYILTYDAAGNVTALTRSPVRFKIFSDAERGAASVMHLRMQRMPGGKFILSGRQFLSSSTPPDDTVQINGQKIAHSMFAACFNSNWQLLWKKENDTIYGGFNTRPVVDAASNIYLAGTGLTGTYFSGYQVVNTLSSNSELPLLIKLDSAGNLLYGRNGSANAASFGTGLTLSMGKVYLAGSFPATLIFGNKNLYNPFNTGYDIFLASFDAATGNIIALDSLKSAAGYNDGLGSMAADRRGNIFLGGFMGNALTIGATNITSAGGTTDLFLAKFGHADCAPCNPATPVITAGGPVNLCTGGSVTLQSNVSSGNQWYRDGMAIANENAQTFIVTASGIYSVKTTSGSCTSASSNGISVVVQAIPPAPVLTANGPITFCAGFSTQLSSSAASGNQWYVNGTAIAGAAAQTYSASTAGPYTVKTTVNGCTSPASNQVTITVHPFPPTPVISISGNILSSSAATGNQWFRDGAAITGATGPTYTATVAGQYRVFAIVNNCVSNGSNIIAFVPTSLQERTATDGFLLGPNPLRTTLFIQSSHTGIIHVSLYDLHGKELLRPRPFYRNHLLDLQSFAAGYYILRLKKGNQVFQKRILKVNGD